ncbi:acyl-CoA synthetase [Rhodobacterales bacterium 52_120_T64]|nr:acyl-CoA synthetase [Rhodobacterales bacterium 52_120_T64]
MPHYATLADKIRTETDMTFAERVPEVTLYQVLARTTANFPDRRALSFQIKSGVKDKAETLSWTDLKARVTQAANVFRGLGVGEKDVVTYLLPNCNEAVVSLLGGTTAGIVNPINPTIEDTQIASILRETGAKVVVTLKSFPKTDVAQKVANAIKMAPNVETVLEVDLARYLTPPLSWIVPLIRPKVEIEHSATVLDFNAELNKANGTALDFEESDEDRVASYFHTGGTTGMPKVAQHKFSGMNYQGWCAKEMLFTEEDVLICPLPMFHVFAAYPVLMACLASGAHMVMPTPQGYRGEGVFDNYWKLLERWDVTFMVTVPTAVSALMQRPVDADVSKLRYVLCGSAPLPVELAKRFEESAGVKILEGYGMTEATCLVSINPPHGERKMGSVGLPFPYCEAKILHNDVDGKIINECAVDEIGEICVDNPGVVNGSTYTEVEKNTGLFAGGKYLRTGDLGRIDADGYLWITGRAKDLIIRGGHNIDPALIEDALAGHESIAFSGAIGQPDEHSGELPCVYVELVDGADISTEELKAYLKSHIGEKAAIPKYVEILDELPKTQVGKIFKPDLRKMAITRVYDTALAKAGIDAIVETVFEDKKRGLVAVVKYNDSAIEDDAVNDILGCFTPQWDPAK